MTTTARPALLDRYSSDERVATYRAARDVDLLPYFRVVDTIVAPTVTMEGAERIMLGSANYLGLAAHPRVKKAARDAVDKFGSTTTGSRLLNGTTPIHAELEEEIADWHGTESAIVFTSGYQTNVGTVGSLLQPGDTAVIDSADHASLQDGCALSGAKVRAFRHNRLDLFWEALERASERDPGAVLVIVDGVYSMEGDAAPLDEIADACQRYGALLMVDEAHSVGLFGERGTGAVELFGVEDCVDIRMAAMSKALAGLGGFIAGSTDILDYVRTHARGYIFSTAGTPAQVAANLAAVRVCRSPEGRELAERVKRHALRLREGLDALGFRLGDVTAGPNGAPIATPIVPVIAGERERAAVWWRALYDQGVFTAAAVAPAVPPTSSLLRLCPMATHTDEQIDRVVHAFEQLREEES